MTSLGATDAVPQWKRIAAEDYEAWSKALPADVFAVVHCYTVPQATNPTAPDLAAM